MNDGPISTRADALDQPAEPARRSRRAMLAGSALAGAGVAAGLLVTASPAGAATGDDLVAGQANAASSTTSLTTSAGSGFQATTNDTALT